MSSLPLLSPTQQKPATQSKPTKPIGPARSVWIWAIPAIGLLAASGAVRLWQDSRFADEIALNKTIPFSLKTLPLQVGKWSLLDGAEEKLDPKIIQIAGASDYILRGYINKENGVVLNVLVLSGPAEAVIGHIPEVCYPANGYVLADVDPDKQIRFGEDKSKSAAFRPLVYAKGGADGTSGFTEEVFYSFRYKGAWQPSPGSTSRITRRSPWVVKVQVQRRLATNEVREIENPSQEFLELLLPQLEDIIQKSGAKDSVAGAESQPAPAAPLAVSSTR